MEPVKGPFSPVLKPLPGIRCVAFDFYGTMFISGVGDIGIDEEKADDSPALFQQALEQTGITIYRDGTGEAGISILEDTLLTHINRAKAAGTDFPEPDIREVWKEVLGGLEKQEYIAGNFSEDTVERFAIEFEFRINQVWPMADLNQTLDAIGGNGIELGIISNSQFYTPLAFEALSGRSPGQAGFESELMVWSYEAGVKKPSVAFYKQFLEKAIRGGLAAGEILFVGNDLWKDIEPAARVGMKTALFIGDKRSIRHNGEDLEKTEYPPDVSIDRLGQLKQVLEL